MGVTPVFHAGSPNFSWVWLHFSGCPGICNWDLNSEATSLLGARFFPSAVTDTALIISGADADPWHTGVWLPFPPRSHSHSSFHPILLLRTKLHPHWGAKLETEPAVPSGIGLCEMKATQMTAEGSDGETAS